jgi:hypothetical protein
MNDDFQTLFNSLRPMEPAKGLSLAILLRIRRHEERIARFKFFFLSLLSVISGTSLFHAVSYALRGFAETGFYEYLSLLSSDGFMILPYWKEFTFTMIETVPVFEISLVLAILYALLESLKSAIRNAPVAFYQFR